MTSENGNEEVAGMLQKCLAHLQYFSDFQRDLVVNIQRQQQPQHPHQILFLYFALVGRDLLGVDWTEGGDGDSDVLNGEKKKLFEGMQLCYNDAAGGFHSESANYSYTSSPTLTITHSALHILNMCDMLPKALSEWLYKEKVLSFILSCQIRQEHPLFGESFRGAFQTSPTIAEVDLRFTYSALVSLALLSAPLQLSTVSSLQDVLEEAVGFIWRCWNPHEGGFGAVPGAESHGGMTFCAVASLTLAGAMSSLTRSRRHLLFRYCTARVSEGPEDHESLGNVRVRKPMVGYQGRPQKDCDTCYAHWIGSTLCILQGNDNPSPLVDHLSILRFIDACTDSDQSSGGGGGIRKSFDVSKDIVHSSLGLSGFLLHVDHRKTSPLQPPHPVYGCSWSTVRRTGLPELLLSSSSS